MRPQIDTPARPIASAAGAAAGPSLLRSLLGALLVAALASGCATYEELMDEVRLDYEQGRYDLAAKTLVEYREDDASNAHLFSLEEGVIELARGDARASRERLEAGRAGLDENAKHSWNGWVQSLLLDDQQLDYPGDDWEHVLVRALLAVADLMAGGEDAEAYANEVIEAQLRIMDGFDDGTGKNPKSTYKLVAFGSYLRGIIAEESPLRSDVARDEFQRVVELEPGFRYGQADLERVTSAAHSAPGNGVVHILALVGRGPYKVEQDEPVTTAAIAIAQLIWAIIRDRVTIPNFSTVKIPVLVRRQGNPQGVEVRVGGEVVGETATVTDVEATAWQQFEAMKDSIIARAIVRRLLKVVVTEGVKEAVNRDKNPWVDLGISAAGLAWTAFERADTRCWMLLPASFQVLRVELPAGEHEIELRALANGAARGTPQRVRVRVSRGFNTYVTALVPTVGGGPPPLTSQPADPPSVGEPSAAIEAAVLAPGS